MVSGNIYEFTPDGTRSTFASGLNNAELPSLRAYSHSDANSDTDSYGDDNSKPEPDRDGHVYTNGGTEIYTYTTTAPDSAPAPLMVNNP